MTEVVAAGLGETIRALRKELNSALSATPDEGIVFDLGEARLELEITVTKDASADGGVRFGVISFGARARLVDEATHRISLTLQPLVRDSDGTTRKAVINDQLTREPT